jgi:trans-aconitate methyltransferase
MSQLSINTAPDSRFAVRECPLCGSGERRSLITLEAAQFCSVNWTYRADFRALLGLPAEAFFPIDQCVGCGFVYARLLPDEGFLAALYDRLIDQTECISGSENRASYSRRLRYVAHLLDLAPGRAGLSALDLGSGLGVTLRTLGACQVNAWGVEPSASRRAYAGGARHQTAADLAALAGAGPFDLLVCDNVLEHLPDPCETIRRIAPLLAPDAVAYVSVPGYENGVIHAQIRAIRHGQAVEMTLNPWEHLNYFSLRHLDALMHEAGFLRLIAASRPHVDIGLRPELRFQARLKNSVASAVRLARYAFTGDVGGTAESAFYRRAMAT